eukprot:gene39297-13741_t
MARAGRVWSRQVAGSCGVRAARFCAEDAFRHFAQPLKQPPPATAAKAGVPPLSKQG